MSLLQEVSNVIDCERHEAEPVVFVKAYLHLISPTSVPTEIPSNGLVL